MNRELEIKNKIIMENDEKIAQLFHDNSVLRNRLTEIDEKRLSSLSRLEQAEYEFQSKLKKEVEFFSKKEIDLNSKIRQLLEEVLILTINYKSLIYI